MASSQVDSKGIFQENRELESTPGPVPQDSLIALQGENNSVYPPSPTRTPSQPLGEESIPLLNAEPWGLTGPELAADGIKVLSAYPVMLVKCWHGLVPSSRSHLSCGGRDWNMTQGR